MQWIRQCGLIISVGKSSLDLSQLRIRFEVKRAQTETPNQAQIKVYNLTDDTANLLIQEGQQVTLEAGYQDNFGVIFSGQCISIKKGREGGNETYVEITASDGDNAYNYSFINTTLASGSTQQDHLNALQKSMGIGKTQVDSNTKPLPRGKVMFGEAKHHMRKSAHANNQDWSIQDGHLQVISQTNTLKTKAIILNSKSGLIGGAEQSTNGIKAKALLNPMIKIGAQIVIDEKDVQQAKLTAGAKPPKAGKKPKKPSKTDSKHSANKPATITHDGAYKVIEVSYLGDTYSTDWYCDITCIEAGAVKSGKEK
jgi:hypothetical protein